MPKGPWWIKNAWHVGYLGSVRFVLIIVDCKRYIDINPNLTPNNILAIKERTFSAIYWFLLCLTILNVLANILHVDHYSLALNQNRYSGKIISSMTPKILSLTKSQLDPHAQIPPGKSEISVSGPRVHVLWDKTRLPKSCTAKMMSVSLKFVFTSTY